MIVAQRPKGRKPAPGNAEGVWFFRTKRGSYCGLKPASTEGRMLTGFYAALVSGVSWFFAGREFDTAGLIAFVVLILAATFLFIVTALRMSAPAPEQRKRGRPSKGE